jgi:hypothetical protein
MAWSLESQQVDYNRRVVLASTIIVLFFSNGSYILRLLARRMQNQRLQLDDYLMGLALPFSYIPAVCLLYGLTVGLGEHVKDVSKVDLRKFNIVSKAYSNRDETRNLLALSHSSFCNEETHPVSSASNHPSWFSTVVSSEPRHSNESHSASGFSPFAGPSQHL